MSNISHDELIERAERWLKNTFHCRVVLVELVAYTLTGETPDVIGWVNNRSILVECKSNRADYLADKKKRARQEGFRALGHWRFYLTPPNIIMPSEIPEGWGIYEVQRRTVNYRGGAKYANAKIAPFNSDRESEVAMLLSALARRAE